MTVYDLKNKDLKKEFRKFAKGVYGKVVFCLAYAIPLLSLIISVEMFTLSKVYSAYEWCYRPLCALSLIAAFVTFILGSRYFYKEFIKFYETTHKEEK